jgi:RNA polymerase sigma factor (sigma-70 family)
VAKIAMGYRGYGLPVGDLISEGNVGMMQAVKRFDPDRGFRLATYAMWWIRAAIQEYILHSWSLVKMGTTAAQKKLFFLHPRRRAIAWTVQIPPQKTAWGICGSPGDTATDFLRGRCRQLQRPMEGSFRLAATRSMQDGRDRNATAWLNCAR